MNNNNKKTESVSQWKQREPQASKAWGVLVFGLIGATFTTFAVIQLRRTARWFYTQFNRSQSNSSWTSSTNRSSWRSYREEAWQRYNRRMQEQNEEEMERVERIRRMQNVFNRERDKVKRNYERWREYGPGPYQHFQRDDWYWQTDTDKRQRTNARTNHMDSGNYSMSHHYSVLGLDRSKATPYSEAEIKTAFRAKAMKFHPDQNQDNREAAEAKFKEVMTSYEAIKLERKNDKC